METTKLINKIADKAHVSRMWVNEEFRAEIEDIAIAQNEQEREDAVIYLTNGIDEQIRRLKRLKSGILIAAAEVE